LDLGHPLVASVLLPLVLASGLTGLLRLALSAESGRRLATGAVGFALLVAHLVAFGAPHWPAQSGIEKLPLLFAMLLAGGMVADLLRPSRFLVAITVCLAMVAVTGWLAWPQLIRGESGLIPLLTMASLLGLFSLAGLANAPPESANRPAMLVIAALGLAGASFNAGSLVLMQVALALAAAVGGFALLNWPVARLPFHGAGVAVGGIGCFAVALLLILLTGIRPWALLTIPLIFAADISSRLLPVPARFTRAGIEPLYIVLIGLVPMIAAILLAQSPAPADDLYYR
jgi:hypothetical protein